jgi:AcrR family transcriptional regulator
VTRPPADSAAPTAERLLDAAERLFAEHGIAETSLRTITSEAGANLAAVNYHFGSRLGLVQAVLERRLRPMNAERIERLEALEAQAGSDTPALRDLVTAFLAPAVTMGRGAGRPFFMLVARAPISNDRDTQELFVSQFDEVAARFGAAFARALPGVPPPEILWRLHFVIGALCHGVVNSHLLEMISQGACRADDPALLDRLVDFATAGLTDLQRVGGASS